MKRAMNFWGKNNAHIRNFEDTYRINPKIIPEEIKKNYQNDTLFDNSRIQQPVTPGNIHLSDPAIKMEPYRNSYSSTYVPNIPYTKPMPQSKCTVAYSTL